MWLRKVNQNIVDVSSVEEGHFQIRKMSRKFAPRMCENVFAPRMVCINKRHTLFACYFIPL